MRTWYDAVTVQNNPEDEPDDGCEVVADEVIQAETKRIRAWFNLKRPRTHLSLASRAEELPEGIREGPVEIQVLLSQDGFTTAFDAEVELVDVPHRKDHVIRLMDPESAHKVKQARSRITESQSKRARPIADPASSFLSMIPQGKLTPPAFISPVT